MNFETLNFKGHCMSTELYRHQLDICLKIDEYDCSFFTLTIYYWFLLPQKKKNKLKVF